MTNTSWDGEAIGKALLRRVEASRLEKYLKEPLEEMIHYEGERTFLSASDDLLVLLVFTYIDLLGYLYKGKNSSSNAVEFMREYLGRVDKRYEEVSGLLYDALRHGYIHLATPKRIELQDKKILDFSFSFSKQREDHLKVTKREEIEMTGRLEICRLSMNFSLFYEDLLSAMDKYAGDIRNNQALSDTFWQAFETRRSPEKAKEKELLNKPYIQESDFAFIREQISNL